MNDEFPKRVRSAAIAGWWTLLIFVIFLSVVWLAYLGIIAHRPPFVQSLWGGSDWATVQAVVLWAVAVFKIILYTAAMVVVWLTLWARKLRAA